MALTTETSQQYSVTPPSRQISQEAAILLDKSVIARPLSAPEVASIHVKKTEFYYRWVNRMHSNGRVYMERKAMGFTNATSEDVDVLVGDVTQAEEADGVCKELRSGDLILMKIPFHLWASHVKRNMQTAEVLQRMRGVHTKDEELSGSVFAEGGRPKHESVSNELKGKVSSFIPENPDALIDGQSTADAEKARELVRDMRSRISKGK